MSNQEPNIEQLFKEITERMRKSLNLSEDAFLLFKASYAVSVNCITMLKDANPDRINFDKISDSAIKKAERMHH